MSAAPFPLPRRGDIGSKILGGPMKTLIALAMSLTLFSAHANTCSQALQKNPIVSFAEVEVDGTNLQITLSHTRTAKVCLDLFDGRLTLRSPRAYKEQINLVDAPHTLLMKRTGDTISVGKEDLDFQYRTPKDAKTSGLPFVLKSEMTDEGHFLTLGIYDEDGVLEVKRLEATTYIR